jgi:hypothetical protein
MDRIGIKDNTLVFVPCRGEPFSIQQSAFVLDKELVKSLALAEVGRLRRRFQRKVFWQTRHREFKEAMWQVAKRMRIDLILEDPNEYLYEKKRAFKALGYKLHLKL